jgi:inhibitor of KinA
VTIVPAGDQAFRVRLDADDPVAAAEHLSGARPTGVTDVVVGHDHLLVAFDALAVAPDDVRAWIAAACEGPFEALPARTVEIPVAYDPELAPDLLALAAEKGIDVAELVARHAAPLYQCRLLGFRPGFPFLTGLDERLHGARLPSPRLRVPAGAVGIGGGQTGVYPVESPGGWRLIGRTPLRLFDPARAEPFLVRAGDRVRFVAIDRAAFDRMSE